MCFNSILSLQQFPAFKEIAVVMYAYNIVVTGTLFRIALCSYMHHSLSTLSLSHSLSLSLATTLILVISSPLNPPVLHCVLHVADHTEAVVKLCAVIF